MLVFGGVTQGKKYSAQTWNLIIIAGKFYLLGSPLFGEIAWSCCNIARVCGGIWICYPDACLRILVQNFAEIGSIGSVSVLKQNNSQLRDSHDRQKRAQRVSWITWSVSPKRSYLFTLFGYPVWLLVIAFRVTLFFSFRSRSETARTGKNDAWGVVFSGRPLEDTSLGIGQIPTFRALSQSPQWLENSTPKNASQWQMMVEMLAPF